MKIEVPLNQRVHKPCFDCPFRKDIIPYMDDRCVNDNVERIDKANPLTYGAMCHHSVYEPNGKTVKDWDKLRVCPGYLILMQKIGHEIIPLVPDTGNIYDTVDEFVEYSLVKQMPDESDYEYWQRRRLAWIASQPEHKRKRELEEFIAIRDELEVPNEQN